jgi:hypothetical protein
MIYRDEKKAVTGIYNRRTEFVSKRHIVAFADNLNDLGEFLTTSPKKWPREASRDNAASQSWDMNAGYAGALTMARDGWSEGVAMIDEALQAITPTSGREARWGWAQSGGSVSIGRYLSGNPKPMRNRRRRQAGSAPVLHIVVNPAASCVVTAAQMANYGTAIVGLIDRLENMGKRVHLDVVSVARSTGDARLAIGWNVKKASEPVDLSAVAFAIAHPAAFRRLTFAMMERCPAETYSAGYGNSADILPDDVPDYQEGTMLVDGINHEPDRCNSPKDALRFAIEQLNKASVLAGHTTPDAPLIDEEEWLSELAD